ncbi:unnamed protein product, partial [Closterium sp. NIES-54]
MKRLSEEKQKRIMQRIAEGRSYRQIAQELGVSKSAVHDELLRHLGPKTFDELVPSPAKTGRPRKFPEQIARIVIRSIVSGESKTAEAAAGMISSTHGISVTGATVQNTLKRHRVRAIEKPSKPRLSAKNVKDRMQWAKDHQHWTIDDWKRVVWSDETKICRFSSDGRSWAWIREDCHMEPHHVKQTVKHGGGSIMIWGCMAYNGGGFMCKIDGRMNGELYRSILQDKLQQTIEHYELDPETVVFQHDNDPKHTCKMVKTYLAEQPYSVLPWPASSPDLNPIEHLWVYLKKQLLAYPRPPAGILELWDRVQVEWEKIPAAWCSELIDSMPRRVRAVLKAKGRWTKNPSVHSIFRFWHTQAYCDYNIADPESDPLRTAITTVMRLLAAVVTDPSFESTATSALGYELVDFAAHCRLDYATSLVAESESASICPPTVEGEYALGTNVLEERQEAFECFAAAVPHLVSMLLASEGDPDAQDIPTPRSYAEAIEGPYSSQWQAAMDAEMASWKSKGTYIDEVPPPGANIVSGMWIFRVKRPPGSPPVFNARYVARGFSQRQGVDFFKTFSPTLKMTTLRVLLHVTAQRDYELHSLDFSTAFLQGNLHEEIWLRRPPGFTGSFPASTQWSLGRPVYGLRQAPHEWNDTLRTTLAALGFAPSTADPSLFLRTDATLPPFYVLVYVDDLVFATADTEALAHVKSKLQKRHTCTDLGEMTSYLGLRITRDRVQRTITLTQSHMVQQ